MVHRSSVPLFWRIQKSKYRMVGSKCLTCESLFFPTRTLCPNCRGKGKMEDFGFSGNGEILSYTIVRTSPGGFEKQSPYAVGIIKLEEGVNVSGQIVGDVNAVDIGKRVKPVFRKMYEDGSEGLIYYGLKFELADGHPGP